MFFRDYSSHERIIPQIPLFSNQIFLVSTKLFDNENYRKDKKQYNQCRAVDEW